MTARRPRTTCSTQKMCALAGTSTRLCGRSVWATQSRGSTSLKPYNRVCALKPCQMEPTVPRATPSFTAAIPTISIATPSIPTAPPTVPAYKARPTNS
uniref:Uncharacterized protein n=1 Tax=Anguilla anguilla TaxID=7936 RepID=A0A0E9X6K6_ANGAN